MLNIAKFIIYIIISQILVGSSYAADSSDDWTNSSLSGLAQRYSDCLEAPSFSNFYTSSQTLNISNGGWVSTGSKVQANKLLKMSWSIKNIEAKPKKYLVMFRLDPRFNRPQVFIQKYDYNTNRYISDFHEFGFNTTTTHTTDGTTTTNTTTVTAVPGKLVKYQNNFNTAFANRISDYNNYFNFVGRNKISVSSGDVLNINLITSADFFVGNSDFNEELDYPFYPLSVIYTETGLPDNAIISLTSQSWCNVAKLVKECKPINDQEICYTVQGASGYNSTDCQGNVFKAPTFYKQDLVGILPPFYPDLINGLVSCEGVVDINNTVYNKVVYDSTNSTNRNVPSLCYLNDGRGMIITVGGNVIKKADDGFFFSEINKHYLLYKKIDSNGDLDFNTTIPFSDQFVNFPKMSSWGSYNTESGIVAAIENNSLNIARKNEQYGRYFLKIEVGRGDGVVSSVDADKIKVEYIISNTEPSSTTRGTPVDPYFNITAPNDGYLWLRVENPNTDLQGIINIEFSNYTGSTLFSDTVYNKIIVPVLTKFNGLTATFYNNVISNSGVQIIGRTLLALYIMFYFAWFLSGAVDITTKDLVIRATKILLISVLLGEGSWTFFSKNLFSWFTEGLDFLFSTVGGTPSSTRNVFAFLDPLVDKYLNPRMWALLGIQLLQITNGITLFSIMSIMALLSLFKSVIQLVIVYIIAFVGLAIMISLAPLFLLLMLFQHTKSMFDNWISVMFDYMIKPTILLIFFLLIDQILSVQMANIVVRACWGKLFDIAINVDLNHLGIPIDFSFTLPFLPYIPFWVPQPLPVANVPDLFVLNGTLLRLVTTSLLFFSLSKMISGLISYATLITSSLTNVMPAQREGPGVKGNKDGDVTESITSDLKSVTTDPVKSVGRSVGGMIKKKAIDQDYSSEPAKDTTKEDKKDKKPKSYADKIKTNRHDV